MASGIELATAYVNLTVSAKDIGPQVSKQFGGVEKQADKAGKAAGGKFSGGMGAGLKGLAGMFAGVMAGIGVKDFLGDALGEARESQKVGALTESIIKSTGSAAKVTAGQVGSLAEAISSKTGKDDELVQTGANLLLTFKNVRNEAGKGNDVFNQATAAAVDLSAAGFGSVDGAAKMLGKALNDPLKGISALGRAGVTFTAAQKKQIETMVKSGDVLGAQKIIMKEVESQVGGAAAATATAGEKARVTFDNLKEAAGTKLLPIVDNLATKFTDLVAEFQAGEGAGGRIRDIFSKVGDIFGEIEGGVRAFTAAWVYNDGEVTSSGFAGFMERLGYAARQTFDYFANTVWPFMQKYQDVLISVGGGILAIVAAIKVWSAVTKAYAAVQAALNAVMALNPIGVIILAIVGLVAAFVILYKRNEAFRDLVNKVWAAIKGAILAVVDWFKNTAWPWMRDALENIKGAFGAAKTKISEVWAGIKSAIGAAWDWIRANVFDRITSALAALKDRFVAAKDNVVAAWGLLKTGLQSVYTWVKTNVFDKLVTAVEAIKGKFSTAVSAIGTAWDAVKALAKAPVKFIIDTVLNNGLIGGFNWLSGKIGGPHIDPIRIPGFARGGVLPGYTPGRDVHRFISPTGGILDLSGGEAIMRPEWTRAMGGAPGVARQNAMARAGTLPSQAFAGGGVLGWIKGKAKGAFDWMSDKAGAIFSALSSPAGYLKDKVSGLFGGMPDGAKMPAEYGKAMVGKGVAAAAEKIKALFESFKSAFAQSEDTGGSFGGGVGMGYKAQVAWAKANIPWAAITSTVRTGNPASDHDKGRAIDLAGGNMGRIFDAIKSHFSIPSIKSLYYSPKGASQVRFGKVSNTPPHIFNTHWDHVHWAMANGGVIPKPLLFDRGGVLPTGTSLVHNGTGAPEPLARVGGDGVRLHPEDIDLLAAAIRRGASDGISGLAGRVGSYAPVGRF